jgi:hypothetical protein
LVTGNLFEVVLSLSFIGLYIIMPMSQTEFNNCPECKVGKMRPTGGAAVTNDPQTGRETGFQRDYKCDNCGYPHGGKAIVLGVNEQVNIRDSPPAADDKNNRHNNDNSSGNGELSSRISYPDELNNRVHFKFNAARRHLDNLMRLEIDAGSLAVSEVRVEAEQGIDECLYQLIGVKDALLQEVNAQLNLGIPPRKVSLETMNPELDKRGADARDIIKEIKSMVSDQSDPRWLINELHNHSKHRGVIGQAINVVDGTLDRASLIDPRTGQGMRRPVDGTRILAIDYLEESYASIEELQRTVRNKIRQYLNSHNLTRP